MVYTIVPQGLKRSYGFVNLDLPKGYDSQKIEVEDSTPDGGLYFGHGRSMVSGRRVKTDHFLKTLNQYSGRKIPDFDCLHGFTYVSDCFKSVVESVEPGIHQFIPFQIIGPKKLVLADMYFMVVCNRLDSMDREETTFLLDTVGMWLPGREVPREQWPPNFDPNIKGKFVFNLAQIGNHHLWHDKYSSFGPYLSDTLADALMSAGVTGADFIKQEAV
jgi:hypothetical protein